MELDGLTGKMRFDSETGNRNYFKLDVVRVQESKKHRLGSWDPVNNMTLARSVSEINSEFAQSITNKTFIVVGKLVSISSVLYLYLACVHYVYISVYKYITVLCAVN